MIGNKRSTNAPGRRRGSLLVNDSIRRASLASDKRKREIASSLQALVAVNHRPSTTAAPLVRSTNGTRDNGSSSLKSKKNDKGPRNHLHLSLEAHSEIDYDDNSK